ncbi:MAG: hypothetical protein JW704_02540 [Anaerolineaceae bacterium]|nr:hypothetical protein [Anaerolineaceae bacterium]
MIEKIEREAGIGPGGKCKCPECGAETEHEIGKPCNDTKCPKCGAMMGRLSEGNVAQLHMLKIAAKTLTMANPMVGVMGGPSKVDAIRTLLANGYREKDIVAFLKKGKHGDKEIADLMRMAGR